jgi:hypothetical protein
LTPVSKELQETQSEFRCFSMVLNILAHMLEFQKLL